MAETGKGLGFALNTSGGGVLLPGCAAARLKNPTVTTAKSVTPARPSRFILDFFVVRFAVINSLMHLTHRLHDSQKIKHPRARVVS